MCAAPFPFCVCVYLVSNRRWFPWRTTPEGLARVTNEVTRDKWIVAILRLRVTGARKMNEVGQTVESPCENLSLYRRLQSIQRLAFAMSGKYNISHPSVKSILVRFFFFQRK